ncbi:DUF6350 family protein [Schaalia vaccimaxillae]|uniref:cell division protein PerM n=1 Tax=Schaalia vaccimaxillae TaxID=183916 RepID=UPI0003B63BB7|nr:DUF6350 family protein [Schaalia vaccimaxillae]
MSDNTNPTEETRTSTTTYVASRPTIRISMPDGWARAALSGIEVAFLGWAFVTLSGFAAYASVSTNPWLGSATWEGVLGICADVYAAVLGGTVTVGDVGYRAIPTLLGLLLICVLRILLRSNLRFPLSAVWFAVPGFAIPSLIVVAASATHTHWWTAILGAVLIPVLACSWLIISHMEEPPRWLRLHRWASVGLRMAVLYTAALVVVGLIFAVTAIVVGWERVTGIHELLLTTSLFEDVLAVGGQVFFLPTIIAWVLAWLAGPGFFVGADALHSPSHLVENAIPGIPVLGMMPESTPGSWVALTILAVGIALGVWLAKKHPFDDIRHQATMGAVAAAGMTVVVAAWMWSATMVLGSARLAVFGPRVGWVTFWLFLEVGVAALLTSVALHPTSIEFFKEQWRISLTPTGQPVPQPAASEKPLAQAVLVSDEELQSADDDNSVRDLVLAQNCQTTADEDEADVEVLSEVEERSPDDALAGNSDEAVTEAMIVVDSEENSTVRDDADRDAPTQSLEIP